MPDSTIRAILRNIDENDLCDLTEHWSIGLAKVNAFATIHHATQPDPMPAPDQKPPELEHDAARRRAMFDHQMAAAFTGSPRATLDDVLIATRVLTDEVRRLRDAIEPPASGLILGAEAAAEFARITRVR